MAMGGKQSPTARELSKPKKPKAVESAKPKPKTALNRPGWIGQNATSLTPRTSVADTPVASVPPPGIVGSGTVSPGIGTGGATATGTGVPGTNPEPYQSYFGSEGTANPGAGVGGYTDLALNSGLLYDHPEVLAADYLASIGITNPEVIDMLTKQADLGYALQFILEGGGNQIPSNADITGFVQQYIAGLMTPGGGGLDLNAMMAEVLNADPTSPLGQYMAQNGPDAVNNLIMSAAMATTNPYYQNALKGSLDTQSRDYYGNVARGTPPDSYYQGLGTSPLAGYFGR